MSHLTELVDALRHFVGTFNKGEPALLWDELSRADGRIRRACEEAAKCALTVDPERDLGRCRALMQKEVFEERIAKSFRWPADGARLARHAQAMIATAGAAAAIQRGDSERFLGWWAVAAPLLSGVATGRPPLLWHWPQNHQKDPHAALEHAADVLGEAEWITAGAQDWTRHWLLLAGFPRLAAPLRAMTVPVLAHESGDGCVSKLRLDLLIEGAGRPYEAIQCGFHPLGRDLVSCVNEACQRVQGTVRWSLIPGEGASTAMKGRSLGAAAHVGAVLLNTDRPYDQRCVITGQMNGDHLEKVECEREKFVEAAKLGYLRGGVAIGVKAKLDDQEFEVVELATLEDAVVFASGLATELRGYLTGLTQGDGALAAYLGGRSPIDLFVEPDVLSSRRQVNPADGSGIQCDLGSAAPNERTLGEVPIRFGQVQQVEVRRKFEHELEEVLGGKTRCMVVLGAPGQGKSELCRMAARRKALSTLAELATQQSPLDSLILPVMLTLRKLTENGIMAGETSEEALRRTVGAAIGGEVGRYVKSHLHEQRVWLFLDALDEVPADALGVLGDYLDVLRCWECRLILTSRPHAYNSATLRSALVVRLAPFDDGEVQDFIERWFGSENERMRYVKSFLNQARVLKTLRQNPMMLAIMCAQLEDSRQIKGQGDLIRQILAEVASAKSPPLNHGLPLDTQILEEHAFRSFQKNEYRFLDSTTANQNILREWHRVGVVLPTETLGASWRFTDPAIRNYFAGARSARLGTVDTDPTLSDWPAYWLMHAFHSRDPEAVGASSNVAQDLRLVVASLRELGHLKASEMPGHAELVAAVCTRWEMELEHSPGREPAVSLALATLMELSYADRWNVLPAIRLNKTSTQAFLDLASNSGLLEIAVSFCCEAVNSSRRRADPTERRWVYWALGKIKNAKALACLQAGLLDEDDWARQGAVEALRL